MISAFETELVNELEHEDGACIEVSNEFLGRSREVSILGLAPDRLSFSRLRGSAHANSASR